MGKVPSVISVTAALIFELFVASRVFVRVVTVVETFYDRLNT